MHRRSTTRWLLVCSAVLGTLLTWTSAAGNLVWFDPTNNGQPFPRFTDLALSYHAFLPQPEAVITFNDLPQNTKLGNQYFDRFGVTFENTALGRYASSSRVWNEDGAVVEDLTGYDGSYMPDGDRVFVKFDNHLPATPFTIRFKDPVASVGAFVAMGMEGSVHTLSLSAYDAARRPLGSFTLASWLWETSTKKQNYESFFGLRAEKPAISYVEIRNNSKTDFANALVIDNVAFSRTPVIPEAGTLALLAAGAAILFPRRSGQRLA